MQPFVPLALIVQIAFGAALRQGSLPTTSLSMSTKLHKVSKTCIEIMVIICWAFVQLA
jgi:hypothetical protein